MPPRVSLYAPLRFEIPLRYQWTTKTIGMGRSEAEQAAATMDKDTADLIILFGSAGALNPKLAVGQCFLISSVGLENQHYELPISKNLAPYPSASLWTSHAIVSTPEAKRKLFEKTQCDLVDMEMAYLYGAASPSLRSRLIFVRAIIDSAHDAIDLKKTRGLLRLAKNWPATMRGLSRFLDRLVTTLKPSLTTPRN